MAAITLKTAGDALVANAASVASAASITEAQAAAIGRLLLVMSDDHLLAPLLKLSATDQGNITTTG